jgi:hypothetical protein
MEPETDKPAEPAEPAEPRPKPAALARLQQTRLPLWISLVLLLLLIIALAWNRLGTGSAERRLAEERQQLTQQLEADRSAMQREAQEALARQTQDMQILFGTALAWSVRSAMLRNNFDEIDQYFVDLVKNPRVTLALLADVNGKVLRTSDRKYLDTPFSEHFPAELLKGEDVAVHPDEGDRKRLVLPIQGLTARLGTVLLVYSPPA